MVNMFLAAIVVAFQTIGWPAAAGDAAGAGVVAGAGAGADVTGAAVVPAGEEVLAGAGADEVGAGVELEQPATRAAMIATRRKMADNPKAAFLVCRFILFVSFNTIIITLNKFYL